MISGIHFHGCGEACIISSIFTGLYKITDEFSVSSSDDGKLINVVVPTAKCMQGAGISSG